MDQSNQPLKPTVETQQIHTKKSQKPIIILSIVIFVLIATTIGLAYLYYKEKNSETKVSTTSEQATNSTANTTAASVNLDFYVPITKDGVTFYYPKEWPEPKVESASAQGFVSGYRYGVEIAYQYDETARSGEGTWTCTNSDVNQNICTDGTIYYPKTARKDRSIGSDSFYTYTTVYDFSAGEINATNYIFTVPNKDKMVTLSIPTICEERLPDFTCEASAIKATDKTGVIIDDIINYIKIEG